jgi:hypothetical protein
MLTAIEPGVLLERINPDHTINLEASAHILRDADSQDCGSAPRSAPNRIAMPFRTASEFQRAA